MRSESITNNFDFNQNFWINNEIRGNPIFHDIISDNHHDEIPKKQDYSFNFNINEMIKRYFDNIEFIEVSNEKIAFLNNIIRNFYLKNKEKFKFKTVKFDMNFLYSPDYITEAKPFIILFNFINLNEKKFNFIFNQSPAIESFMTVVGIEHTLSIHITLPIKNDEILNDDISGIMINEIKKIITDYMYIENFTNESILKEFCLKLDFLFFTFLLYQYFKINFFKKLRKTIVKTQEYTVIFNIEEFLNNFNFEDENQKEYFLNYIFQKAEFIKFIIEKSFKNYKKNKKINFDFKINITKNFIDKNLLFDIECIYKLQQKSYKNITI